MLNKKLLSRMCISYTILLKILLKTNFFSPFGRNLMLQIFCRYARYQILIGKGFDLIKINGNNTKKGLAG